MIRPPPNSTPFPSPPLSRSASTARSCAPAAPPSRTSASTRTIRVTEPDAPPAPPPHWEADIVAADGRTVHLRPICPEDADRSEEHTSELQSRQYLVCRLLLE